MNAITFVYHILPCCMVEASNMYADTCLSNVIKRCPIMANFFFCLPILFGYCLLNASACTACPPPYFSFRLTAISESHRAGSVPGLCRITTPKESPTFREWMHRRLRFSYVLCVWRKKRIFCIACKFHIPAFLPELAITRAREWLRSTCMPHIPSASCRARHQSTFQMRASNQRTAPHRQHLLGFLGSA